MSPFPLPYRFDDYQKMCEFIKTRNPSLTVPSHIFVYDGFRQACVPNPAYEEAPWEERIIFHKDVTKLMVLES